MKNNFIKIYLYTEGGPSGGNSDDVSTQKEQNDKNPNQTDHIETNTENEQEKSFEIQKKEFLESLSEDKREFLGLEGNSTKTKKTEIIKKEGKLVLKLKYFGNTTILDKDTIEEIQLEGFISEDKKSITKLGINIFDIILNYDDSMKSNESIASYINGNIDFLRTILKNAGNGYIGTKIKKDNNFFKDNISTLLYAQNFKGVGEKKIQELINIYDNKILNKEGLSEHNKEMLLNNFFGDIATGCKNLDFYKQGKIDKLISQVKIKNDSDVGIDSKLQILGMYNEYLGIEKFTDKLDISGEINQEFDKYLTKYDISFLANKLPEGKKVSINELIAINLFLSGKDKEVEKLGVDVKNIANKFGYSDIKQFKKEIYDQNIVSGLLTRKIDSNKGIFYELPLNKAIKFYYLTSNLVNLPEDEKEKGFKKYKKILSNYLVDLEPGKKDKFLEGINKILKNNGLKELDNKSIEENYQKTINDKLLFMNGVEKFNIEEFIKKFKIKFKDSLLIKNEYYFKQNLRDIFKKDNLKKLKKKFEESKLTPIDFLKQELFENGQLGDILKTKNGKNLTDAQETKIISYLLEGIAEKTKGDNIIETRNMVKENKEIDIALTNSIDKEFDKENKKTKDLILASIQYNIGQLLVKYHQNKLTKEFIQNHKEEIIKFIKDNIEKIGLSKTDGKIKNIINSLIKDIPKEGYVFNKKQIDELVESNEWVKNIEKDVKIYHDLGYEGYRAYCDDIQYQKELLEDGPITTTVNISETPFSSDSNNYHDVQTKYEEKNGIHTIYMKVPGKKEVYKIDSLSLEDANHEVVSTYLNNMFGFPIRLIGDADHLNKFVSRDTNVSKDALNNNDFTNIFLKMQNIIYNNFYTKENNKEQRFLKDNHIEDPYEMYARPDMFFQKFALGMKKEVSIGGIKADLKGYVLDLSTVDSNLLNIEIAEKTKEQVLDRGEQRGQGVFGIINGLKNKFFG